MSKAGDNSCVVRLRGLPWTARKDDLSRFLCECKIKGGEDGIHFTYSREGRPSGEAFVELEGEEDITHALAQNREHIGDRYIEVFKVDKSEMDWTVKHNGAGADAGRKNPEAVVKLRGLPFGCSKEEISEFFTGMQIVANGIMIPDERPGKSTGEAFVQFATPEIAEKALTKHKQCIGHRWIEIFNSSLQEADACSRMRPMMCPRPGPYDRGDRGFGMGGMNMNPCMGMGYNRGRGGRNLKGYFEDDYDDYGFCSGMGFGGGMRNRRGGNSRGNRGGASMAGGQGGGRSESNYMSKTGHSVHLRGLPFNATKDDVMDFFSPIQFVRCEFEYSNEGRPTGEANVDFVSHQEALDAMKKNRSNMQHRYIELFLNSEPAAARNSSGGGGGYGNGMGGAGGSGFDNYHEDLGPGGFDHASGSGFGGGYGGSGSGYGSGGQSGFGGGQGGSGFGNSGGGGGQGGGGYGSQQDVCYDMGGGFGDGMGKSGGFTNKNYTAF